MLASDRGQGGIDHPDEEPRGRDKLVLLASDRRNRMQENGRPRFDLTEDEIERSTWTAMHLADASKSQAEARTAERD